MPLIKGTSNKTRSKNIAEFHTGKTYQRTREKFGKAVADRQAVAAGYAQQREARKRKRETGRKQRAQARERKRRQRK